MSNDKEYWELCSDDIWRLICHPLFAKDVHQTIFNNLKKLLNLNLWYVYEGSAQMLSNTVPKKGCSSRTHWQPKQNCLWLSWNRNLIKFPTSKPVPGDAYKAPVNDAQSTSTDYYINISGIYSILQNLQNDRKTFPCSKKLSLWTSFSTPGPRTRNSPQTPTERL